MATTYCINCINFYDSREPKLSMRGSFGIYDRCIAKDAPLNDFVRALANPADINKGACTFYAEKSKLDSAKVDKVE